MAASSSRVLRTTRRGHGARRPAPRRSSRVSDGAAPMWADVPGAGKGAMRTRWEAGLAVEQHVVKEAGSPLVVPDVAADRCRHSEPRERPPTVQCRHAPPRPRKGAPRRVAAYRGALRPRGPTQEEDHQRLRPRTRGCAGSLPSSVRPKVHVAVCSAQARLSHPWKSDQSPASHAWRSPGVLRSQSGRISLVAARRSCQRSTTDGRPQNQ